MGMRSAPNAVGYSRIRGDGSSPWLLSNKGTSAVSMNVLKRISHLASLAIFKGLNPPEQADGNEGPNKDTQER